MSKFVKELSNQFDKTKEIVAKAGSGRFSETDQKDIRNSLEKGSLTALQEAYALKLQGSKEHGIRPNADVTFADVVKTYLGLSFDQLLEVYDIHKFDTMGDVASKFLGRQGASVNGDYLGKLLKEHKTLSFTDSWAEGVSISSDTIRWVVGEVMLTPIIRSFKSGGDWRKFVTPREPLTLAEATTNNKVRVKYVKAKGEIFADKKEGETADNAGVSFEFKDVPVTELRAKFPIQTYLLASITLDLYQTHAQIAAEDLNLKMLKKFVNTVVAGDVAGEDISFIGLKESGKLRQNDIAGLMGVMSQVGKRPNQIFYSGEIEGINLNDSLGSTQQLSVGDLPLMGVEKSIIAAPANMLFFAKTTGFMGIREIPSLQIKTSEDLDTDTSYLYMNKAFTMYIEDRRNCAALKLDANFTAYPDEYKLAY